MGTPETAKTIPDLGEKNLLESLKEGKEPNLGELNPLLFPPNLSRRETIEALRLATTRGIERYEGKEPEHIGITWVTLIGGKTEPRFVASWSIPFLDERQVNFLEELARNTYKPHNVFTRKDIGVERRRNPTFYPKITADFGEPKSKRYVYTRIGWCMGLKSGEPDHISEGLLLYREIDNVNIASSMKGEKTHEWFTFETPVDYRGKPVKTKYLVEIRVSDLYQTELVKFVLQTARILNGKEPLPSSELTCEIYQTLNQLGLKKRRREDIYGLDGVIDHIETYLFLPLRHLGETKRRRIEVSSVLLTGVPGTGKTLLAEYFLQQNLGVFLVPVPVDMLAKDLSGKRTIIDRISSVSQETGIPVVIQVDDIGSIAKEADIVNSTLMNLMAGVRERGFFVLASTNDPYELSYQLLQPERFGHILHISLPDEQSRLGILKIHAPEEYFADFREREAVLSAVAKKTDKFDSRLLKAVCDYAQINAMRRDSFHSNLTVGDFEEALRVALKGFNKRGVVEKEERLAKFANQHHATMIGFRHDQESPKGGLNL